MIDFMVLAAPRSGTAWAANWLSSAPTLCLHDPLWDHPVKDLDEIPHSGKLGVACSGLALMPSWVNAHPSPKVILHRNPKEVIAALAAIGLPAPKPEVFGLLWEIDGLHIEWTDLFNDPKSIAGFLRLGPLDEPRHAMLKHMTVTSRFEQRQRAMNPKAVQSFQRELACST